MSCLNKSFVYAFAFALVSAPAMAEDDPDAASEEDVKALDTKISSLAETLEGLREKGSNTVEENAGQIEAAILSAAAIDAAAAKICERIQKSTNRPEGVIFIATDDDISALNDAALFDVQIAALQDYLQSLATAPRGAEASENARGALAVIGAATQLISAIARSEDTVRPISGTIDNPMVLASILANRASCLPGETRVASDALPTRLVVDTLVKKLGYLQASYTSFQASVGEKPTDQQKQVISAYGAFVAALTSEVGATKLRSYLASRDMWDTISNEAGQNAVLRLSIEKSGGTLLQRKNLWTALGARALAVTAGTIVEFRLSQPNGRPFTSGSVYCTTMQTNFKRLHEMGKNGIAAHCRIDGEPALQSQKT